MWDFVYELAKLCGYGSMHAVWGGFRERIRDEDERVKGLLQGRKSSRRKSRGCKSTPARFTADGNADRKGRFGDLGEVRNYGLILHNEDEVWVKKKRISHCKLKMRGVVLRKK